MGCKIVTFVKLLPGNPVGRHLAAHTDDINSLVISQDGHRIVSGGHDKTIRVWDSGSFEWNGDLSLTGCGLWGPNKIPGCIPEDGWIRTSEGGLLLWVPAERRDAIPGMSMYCIPQKDYRRVLWDQICHGANWTSTCSA